MILENRRTYRKMSTWEGDRSHHDVQTENQGWGSDFLPIPFSGRILCSSGRYKDPYAGITYPLAVSRLPQALKTVILVRSIKPAGDDSSRERSASGSGPATLGKQTQSHLLSILDVSSIGMTWHGQRIDELDAPMTGLDLCAASSRGTINDRQVGI